MSNISLAIHGGAGTINKGNMTPELEAEYKRALEFALLRRRGRDVVKRTFLVPMPDRNKTTYYILQTIYFAK
jgi:hypothetical protein